jgi:hypothetical protein
MTSVSFVTSKFFHKNRLFSTRESWEVSTDLSCFALLKQKLEAKGYSANTDDITPAGCADIVIFIDMPVALPSKRENQIWVLIALESVAVIPGSFDRSHYRHFNYIFTWNDAYVDNERLLKINYSFDFNRAQTQDNTTFDKKKLVCLVANNKFYAHPEQLYTERVRLAKWYMRNHPKDFDLYGTRWEESITSVAVKNIIKVARKIRPRCGQSLLSIVAPCYKGSTTKKLQTLSGYKFNICFENVRDEQGYITEKIFDCFFSRCVPIYLGACNIEKYVPASCFIDMRDFDSYESLHKFISSITDAEHQNLLASASRFLSSESGKLFSSEHFAHVISSRL